MPPQVIRSIATLVTGEVLGRLTAFLATTLIARRLGPEGFGIIGFALAVSGYLGLAVSSGLSQIGIREVARAPDRAVAVYSMVATTRLILATGAFVVLAAVAVVLPKSPATQLVTALAGLSFFSAALDPGWVMKGLERPVLASLGSVSGQAVYVLLAWLFVAGPADVARVPVVQFVGELTAAALLIALLVRRERPRLAVAQGLVMLGEARYLTLARLLRLVVISADVVMLGFMASDRAVGLYSAAYRVAFLLMAVAGVVGFAYLPSFAREVQADREATRRLIGDSVGLAAIVGAPLVAGVFVTAERALVVLFGTEYADGAVALRLLALATGVVFLHWSQTSYFVVGHRFRLQAAINGAAAVLNIVLNLILIPPFGIAGAAAATVIAELAVATLGGFAMWRMRVLPPARPLAVPLAAAAVMALAVWLAGDYMPLAGQVGLGALVYGAILVAGRRHLPRVRRHPPSARTSA